MSVARFVDPVPISTGRQRRAELVGNRVRRDGKFFRLGDEKFSVKGVTYGPFAPAADGCRFPDPQQVAKDFELMCQLGANCFRIYHLPPPWLLDLADESELKIFLDVAWPKNMLFVGDEQVAEQARRAVRDAARACGNHPALFALSVVNEVPADLVRYIGREAVERFIDELVDVAKSEAPQCLVTFANFPTTEYLNPHNIDFVCFNVYLHEEAVLRNYLSRLQNLAGEKPLMLGEYGIDTIREQTPAGQAKALKAHVHAVFEEGLAGTFIFSFTDDWFTHGARIEDWAFGLTTADRTPKPAFAAVREVFARVPQTAEVTLPKISVVICSYNGASTIESCLRSLSRLRYPDFEVIVVDDGSTDDTQLILSKFPWAINIHQRNHGLSHARNVGLDAAKGQIVVYTDSDCEVDEDWLYYLALAMVRSNYIGMGGPNLIPDEGSWVADCVGLSPGGPTHVLIDDRTAEHVPGCNMAFWTWALKEVHGFDPQYRKAGDDVDLIWRLQHRGYAIGLFPAAQVWHYRRNTVGAYLRQQRGYGEAEALLKYKHPDHFNVMGASHWRGRIYGGDEIGVRVGRDVIYHGVFGTGLFQTLYRRPASMGAMIMMSVEWHMCGIFVTILGAAFPPLLWLAGAMLATPIVLAITAAVQSPPPRRRHWLARPLIAYLHFRQPIARGWARYSVRLKAKVMRHEARGHLPPHELPLDRTDRETLRYWHHRLDRLQLLEQIKRHARESGWRMRTDSGWSGWDLEIYGDRYVTVRLTTATEKHEEGLLTRVKVRAVMSRFCWLLLVGAMLMCALLLAHVWPFSRPALLLPVAAWMMYLMGRWRAMPPVVGLIDESAESAGFTPLFASGSDAAPRKRGR